MIRKLEFVIEGYTEVEDRILAAEEAAVEEWPSYRSKCKPNILCMFALFWEKIYTHSALQFNLFHSRTCTLREDDDPRF